MFPAYFVTATERASKKFDGAFPHDQDETAVVTPHAVPIALAIHDERACGIRASFIALGTVEHVNDLEAGMPFLFIDQLVVQTSSATPGSGDGKLRILLGVSGQWQGTK